MTDDLGFRPIKRSWPVLVMAVACCLSTAMLAMILAVIVLGGHQ
jgi:hypothetical protein